MSDIVQAKQQREDGGAGRVSTVPWTKRGITELGVLPTMPDMQVVPLSCRNSEEGIGGVRRGFVDIPALDGTEKTILHARDVLKEAQANLDREQVDV